MRHPFQSIRWTALVMAGVLILICFALILRAQRLQSSLESGQFENHYTAAIKALRAQTKNAHEKLRNNTPGNLEIPPKKLLKTFQSTSKTSNMEVNSFSDIKLSGIYVSSTVSLAELNGHLCRVGDTIDGFTLEQINPYEVIFRDPDGLKKSLRLMREPEPIFKGD